MWEADLTMVEDIIKECAAIEAIAEEIISERHRVRETLPTEMLLL